MAGRRGIGTFRLSHSFGGAAALELLLLASLRPIWSTNQLFLKVSPEAIDPSVGAG